MLAHPLVAVLLAADTLAALLVLAAVPSASGVVLRSARPGQGRIEGAAAAGPAVVHVPNELMGEQP